GRQYLGGARAPLPAHSGEGECETIPPLQWLGFQGRNERGQISLARNLRQVVQGRANVADEVNPARPLEQGLRVRSLRARQEAIGVDKPLARLPGHRPRTHGADEEELVGGIENEWRAVDIVELQRAIT